MTLAKRVFGLLLIVFVSLPAFAAGRKRLLAYYPDWAKDQTPAYDASKIPYTKLTHILHAFLLLDPSGNGALQIDPELIEPALTRNAHKAGVKVMISIGGADAEQATAFATIAASAHLRNTFAKNLHAFLVAHDYDGVDIDWEVPNAPDDTTHCTQLMEALRHELPSPRWLISMAIPSDPRGYGTGFDVPALAPLLDFINVMTYDFTGPWMDEAGLNSPLYQDPNDPEQAGSLKTSMDLFHGIYGVPRAKLNIGTAFYGYEFDNVRRLWNYCPSGDCSAAPSWNYGTYIKQRVNAKGWKRYWDGSAQSPYLLYQGTGGKDGLISYDDPISTALKTYYVLKTRDFGGMFMWDLSGDYDGKSQDLLDAMYAVSALVSH
ncbi:glycoside hydrolase, family 18 [Candidatus Koribacter versatilis Ellin345]|uniref:chitinase n=1 Tax=Koribacter versatilis (strain Ellin345) TaxID=204669 RepID=Q1IKS6_KORVE|nr:glycoside hydrolase family 18 protein [Candidatus Koribacter versatilis]ABF42524.1 glycoside hydrolase, family 18 [Candidatus Koribacter versatilis Ellin345]